MAEWGEGDATYRALGGLEGIRHLVDSFYRQMSHRPQSAGIRAMHPDDLTVSADKLTLFLSGWTGGPRLYADKYGPIAIPLAHRHLDIGENERDEWLICMKLAMDELGIEQGFKEYLVKAFMFPAEKIRQVCAERLSSGEP